MYSFFGVSFDFIRQQGVSLFVRIYCFFGLHQFKKLVYKYTIKNTNRDILSEKYIVKIDLFWNFKRTKKFFFKNSLYFCIQLRVLKTLNIKTSKDF